MIKIFMILPVWIDTVKNPKNKHNDTFFSFKVILVDLLIGKRNKYLRYIKKMNN